MKQGPRSANRLFQPIGGLAHRFAYVSLVVAAIGLMVIGKIDALHWSSVITSRGDVVRIISVRRSRDEEVFLYES